MTSSLLPHFCRRWLTNLVRSTRGNVLVITAASFIPIAAVVGGSVDISRAYMAKAKLQQAVDAAALAGRRAMTGDLLSTATPEAAKFFKFNFPDGVFGIPANSVTYAITKPDVGTINVTASTNVPTSIMRLFGYSQIPINAIGQATQNFVNTDIVLVLDTTGSMRCATTESSCSNSSEKPSSKIVALREAVLAFYAQLKPTQDQLATQGLRLRYAVVPYSSTVNVGGLLNSAWIRNPAPYQQSVCTAYNSNGTCKSSKIQPVSVNHSPTWFSSSWSGCIEERSTWATDPSSWSVVYNDPNTFPNDMNIGLIPNGDTATQWAPYDTAAQQTNSQTACPAASVSMKVWETQQAMSNYLDTLKADGGTYHDIGMIWGAHLIQPTGIFSSLNGECDGYGGRPCKRFVIFMTDGLLDTGPTLYSAYGVENNDVRVTGGNASSQDARHQKRFNMMCNELKAAQVGIFVVAFAQGLDSNLTACADPGQAETATDKQKLIDLFVNIGRNIGQLRLQK